MSDDKSKVTMDGSWNRTRDGRKAGVYSVGNQGVYPVHGWIEHDNGFREMVTWTDAGLYNLCTMRSETDLIREREAFRCEARVNVYANDAFASYPSRHSADRSAAPSRIACVKVIIEGHEGDGLEVPAP